MSFLSFLRPNSTGSRSGGRELSVAEIERRAESETGHTRARLLNRAGDLCTRLGDLPGAKSYFGRAIDVYLEAGYFQAAAALCRRLIKLDPGVVRARATLAVLYLGKKLVENAEHEIALVEDYIRVAREAGDHQLLIHRLRAMAEATENQELRVLIGQHLLELGDEETGRKLLYSIYKEVTGLSTPMELDAGEQWDRLLRAAMMTPRDLMEQGSPAEATPAPEHGELPMMGSA